ncbi:MAG: hypothetical protein WEB37_06525 [Bacteroidota bacterium]
MSLRLVLNREPRILIIGSLFIILGVALLLDRLDVMAFRWDKLFWIAAAITGGFLTGDGFLRRKRGRTFWGSLLLVFSVFQILTRFGAIERYDFYTLPALFISFGLAFVCLYALEPREVTLLIPAILLCGAGTISLLWWWEMVDLYEVRSAVRTYWPLILVAIGLSIMVRRRSQTV